MVAGMVGGGLWGAIPGVLKAYASVNEILSTIMLNLVAVQVMNYLLRGPMIDPLEKEGSRIPQTERLTDNAALPTLLPGTRLHLGVLIAVLAAVGPVPAPEHPAKVAAAIPSVIVRRVIRICSALCACFPTHNPARSAGKQPTWSLAEK